MDRAASRSTPESRAEAGTLFGRHGMRRLIPRNQLAIDELEVEKGALIALLGRGIEDRRSDIGSIGVLGIAPYRDLVIDVIADVGLPIHLMDLEAGHPHLEIVFHFVRAITRGRLV